MQCLLEVLRSAASSIGILDSILKILARMTNACLHGYAPTDSRYLQLAFINIILFWLFICYCWFWRACGAKKSLPG